MNPYQSYSSLTLAYVGDAIYEVFIRTKLTENGGILWQALWKQIPTTALLVLILKKCFILTDNSPFVFCAQN